MKIEKGTRLIVRDRRKGKYEAEALRDIETSGNLHKKDEKI